MAEYERRGAALERRWAELAEGNAPPRGTVGTAELVWSRTRQSARQLSAVLDRTAAALQRTAELSAEHAQRREQQGRASDAAEEREAAERAREASQRARAQAEKWLKLSEAPDALASGR
jgi:hypothetical protein